MDFLYKQKVIEEYWPQLKPKIPKFFEGIEVKPSLLHGDLLPANVAEANYKPGLVFINTFNRVLTKVILLNKKLNNMFLIYLKMLYNISYLLKCVY